MTSTKMLTRAGNIALVYVPNTWWNEETPWEVVSPILYDAIERAGHGMLVVAGTDCCNVKGTILPPRRECSRDCDYWVRFEALKGKWDSQDTRLALLKSALKSSSLDAAVFLACSTDTPSRDCFDDCSHEPFNQLQGLHGKVYVPKLNKLPSGTLMGRIYDAAQHRDIKFIRSALYGCTKDPIFK